jgi:hypothetical protein
MALQLQLLLEQLRLRSTVAVLRAIFFADDVAAISA